MAFLFSTLAFVLTLKFLCPALPLVPPIGAATFKRWFSEVKARV
jgi:hypothetical protein